MQPNIDFIKISTDVTIIHKFIEEVILEPRLNVLLWSAITKQTPGLRIGYPAQHLASLITGVEGSRTGARGDDLVDGTEVKSCIRIDQLDTCKDCGQKVLRMEHNCSVCNSSNIDRKNDSKWLITIRSESELNLYTEKIDRVLLILLDYPNFSENQFDTARIQAFEVWPQNSPNFIKICEDYYYKIYLTHIKENPNKTPAPKNFWPESYQFYLCKPIKVFEALINDFNTKPTAEIIRYHPAGESRDYLVPESAPLSIIKPKELDQVFDAAAMFYPNNEFIREWRTIRELNDAKKRQEYNNMKLSGKVIESSLLDCLALRDTSRATPHQSAYSRR